MNIRQQSLWLGVGVVVVATYLRAEPLLLNRFHPDESLYASFAMHIASGHDILLSGVVVDKPPLTFYLNALCMLVWGKTELALRLPSFFAGIVSVGLTLALGRKLYGRFVGHLAAWLMALSPLAILFSVTLFMDTLVTTFVLWALWMTLEKRYRWAALAWAVACASKQTAFFFLPLAPAFILLTLTDKATRRETLMELWRGMVPVGVGLALTATVVFTWDAIRQASVGFWAQGYSDNAPGRLIRANEVGPRAWAWLNWMQYLSASALVNALFIGGLPLLLMLNLRRPSRAALTDCVIVGYLLAYLAVYWLWAFNVWDRYLVMLIPLFALVLARIVEGLMQSVQLQHALHHVGVCVVVISLMLSSALTAARFGYPVGGDHGAYSGIDDMARYIKTLPYEDGVLYDFWLSWQWKFYLFYSPVYVAWLASPDVLEADLKAFGRASPRYLVVPSWESEAEARAAVERAGFTFVLRHTSYRLDGSESFQLYQLVSQP